MRLSPCIVTCSSGHSALISCATQCQRSATLLIGVEALCPWSALLCQIRGHSAVTDGQATTNSRQATIFDARVTPWYCALQVAMALEVLEVNRAASLFSCLHTCVAGTTEHIPMHADCIG